MKTMLPRPGRYTGAFRRAATVVALLAATVSSTAVAGDVAETISKAVGVPQIDAFLPDQYSVAKTQALPIDGVWMISSIGKKIRIEQGRAYALEPWLHLFTLKIQPGMVVLQNFRRTGAGRYSADDLPLLGPATMTLTADGNLDVVVQGKLGPARYGLVRVEPQYPDAFNTEVAAANGGSANFAPAPNPSPATPLPGMPATPAAPVVLPQQTAPAPAPAHVAQPPPVPPDCKPIGVDPNTGATICA